MYSNIFNPQRLYLFVRRQVSLYQQRWLYAVGVILGVMLLSSVVEAIYNPAEFPGIRGNHNALFFLGGIVLTSQIFRELHNPNRSYSFLSLPVSTLDKLIGSWLLTSPLYIIAFSLLSFAAFLTTALIAGVPFSLSHFFADSYGHTLIAYVIFQPIFLWGACYFRKNNFLKTLLALLIFLICLVSYLAFLKNLLLGADGIVVQIGDHSVFSEEVKNTFSSVMKFLLWSLGPYMLLMSYFTLKERQV